MGFRFLVSGCLSTIQPDTRNQKPNILTQHHPKMLPNPTPFLDKLFRNLEKDGVNVSDLLLDHICYRVETVEAYDTMKAFLAKNGEELTESIIGGRPIVTFLLNDPIVYKNRTINCLELPAPKNGSFYKEGYEHVEFVIKESFSEIIDRYPNVQFDTKGMQKPINPDIRIAYTDCSVKFHHQTLEYVIRYLD